MMNDDKGMQGMGGMEGHGGMADSNMQPQGQGGCPGGQCGPMQGSTMQGQPGMQGRMIGGMGAMPGQGMQGGPMMQGHMAELPQIASRGNSPTCMPSVASSRPRYRLGANSPMLCAASAERMSDCNQRRRKARASPLPTASTTRSAGWPLGKRACVEACVRQALRCARRQAEEERGRIH